MYLSTCVLAEIWPELVDLGFPSKLSHSALDQPPLVTYFGQSESEILFVAFDAAVRAYEARVETPLPERAVPLRPKSGLGRRKAVRRRMILSRLMINATEELAGADQISLLASAVEPNPPAAGTVVRVDPFWVLHVLLVFGFVDRELERKQQEILKTYD